MLQKAPQSLVRSALPSAVSRRGEAVQPLGFLLLIFVPSADFRKRVRKPSQTALCLYRACVYPIRSCISPHGAKQGRTGRSHLHRRSLGFVIGFLCSPQNPCKALCGRRCRPLCPARESKATPRFLLLIFVPPADFRKRVRKPPTNGALPLQGFCLPDAGLFLSTRGDTGADTAVTSASSELRLRHRPPTAPLPFRRGCC